MPRLQRIDHIKGYKSYSNYKWDQFAQYEKIKDKERKILPVNFDANFNVIFGENGSGKSSIVDILKSLSCTREFKKTRPQCIKLSLKDEEDVVFRSAEWSKEFSKKDFIFFDSDFVSKNVHTHGTRDGKSGGHKQNAGELILSVDKKYDQLRTAMRESKEAWQKQKNNPRVSDPDLTDCEKSVFEEMQALDADKKAEKKDKLLGVQRDKKKEIQNLERNQQQVSEIAGINLPTLISSGIVLSDIERYKAVFNDVLQSAHTAARQEVVTKVNASRSFYEEGIRLSSTGSTCPFCEQEYGEQAKELIKEYQSIFDATYKEQKSRRNTEIADLLSEINRIDKAEESLRKVLHSKISEYRMISEKYGLETLSAETDKKLNEILSLPSVNLSELKKSLEAIQKDEPASFSEHSYFEIQQVVSSIEKAVRILNAYVRVSRWKIIHFKTERSSQDEIDLKIEKETLSLQKIEFELNCLDPDWAKRQKEIVEEKEKLKQFVKEKDTAKLAYDEYCKEIPAKVVDRIQGFVNDHFHFKFKLVPMETNRQTNEYPFDFEIVDEVGKRRDFDDGLSEGERQVISLCFFFATLPESELKNKIVVFDDPITSLDSRNLKRLVDLIKSKCKEAQTFVLTHHPLFYKYLSKDLGGAIFGVLRNKKSFGGSFIYRENKKLTILDRLEAIPDEMKRRLDVGEMDAQAFTLEHGHLLRYAVEKFVKDGLQGWSETRFENRIRRLREKPEKEVDFDAILAIYNFCDWSNHLHPDKEDPSALNELLLHVEKFVEIAKPHRELWASDNNSDKHR